MENGTRRTADLELDNSDGVFTVGVGGLWYGVMIKIWMGLYLPDGTPYYFPQGVFYITEVTEDNTPSQRTISLSLVDKWCFLDGTMHGNLNGVYVVPSGSNVYEVIESLLLLSRYTDLNVNDNDEPLWNAVDPIAPSFSSYYIDKTYVVDDVTYNAIETPYDITMEYGKTYADIFLECATILGSYIYYDVDGRLTIEPTQDDISDASKPVLWEFTPTEREFLSESSTHDFTSFYNEIIVVGYSTDNNEAYGVAQNNNPSSPTAISVVGRKPQVPYEDTAYYNNEQCVELATYYLKLQTIKQRSVTITSSPIYHLHEDRLISCIRPYTLESEDLLVSQYSLPIGTIGTMSITATSVNELNFDNDEQTTAEFIQVYINLLETRSWTQLPNSTATQAEALTAVNSVIEGLLPVDMTYSTTVSGYTSNEDSEGNIVFTVALTYDSTTATTSSITVLITESD